MKQELVNAIENRIILIRGKQVIIDSELAKLYAVETRALKQAVQRNVNRFPEEFMIRLTLEETIASRSQIVTLNDSSKGRGSNTKYAALAFTEQGVAMLSAVLKSDLAVAVSIEIMQVFVHLKNRLYQGDFLLRRLDALEMRIDNHDLKIDKLMRKTAAELQPKQHGIFFENQIFDAYLFFNGLIRRAKRSIVLIDNYVDETVLIQLSKRNKNVLARIYTSRITPVLKLDLQKHNSQFERIELRRLTQVHDRFLLIDSQELYHIGASVKDLGKKWFAFSKMAMDAGEMLLRLKKQDETMKTAVMKS
jgi:hypothetical protein